MDTRTQRNADGVAVTDPDNPAWRERDKRGSLREAACSAAGATGNQRIRELLGWGLIPATAGGRQRWR